MRILITGILWVLICFMVLPPDLDYEQVRIVLTSGNLAGPLILSGALAVGLVICLSRLGTARAVLGRLNPFLIAFVLLATCSLLWSADPAATLRRLFRLYAFVLACLGFALASKRPDAFQAAVRPILTLLLAGSLVFGLLYPDLAIERSNFAGITMAELKDAWRGLTMQKNSLGAIATAALILWVHAWLSRQAPAWRAVTGIGIAATCLVLSRSSTSLLGAIFTVPFLVFLTRPPGRALRRYTPYLVGLFAALIIVYSLAVLDLVPGSGALLDPIASITGKDLTFSGRTTIWNIVKEQIAQHPLLGIGYAAYWTGPVPSSPSYEFVLRTYVYPSESHNGYLDVINELGFVGAACLIAYLITYLRQSLKLMTFDRTQGALYLALLFQEFIGNLSEAHWWAVGSVNFFILTLATITLARALVEADRRGRVLVPPVAPAPRSGALSPR